MTQKHLLICVHAYATEYAVQCIVLPSFKSVVLALFSQDFTLSTNLSKRKVPFPETHWNFWTVHLGSPQKIKRMLNPLFSEALRKSIATLQMIFQIRWSPHFPGGKVHEETLSHLECLL